MVAKLKAMDYKVKYTRYKGVGHNSWDQTYKNDALYLWMASQKQD